MSVLLLTEAVLTKFSPYIELCGENNIIISAESSSIIISAPSPAPVGLSVFIFFSGIPWRSSILMPIVFTMERIVRIPGSIGFPGEYSVDGRQGNFAFFWNLSQSHSGLVFQIFQLLFQYSVFFLPKTVIFDCFEFDRLNSLKVLSKYYIWVFTKHCQEGRLRMQIGRRKYRNQGKPNKYSHNYGKYHKWIRSLFVNCEADAIMPLFWMACGTKPTRFSFLSWMWPRPLRSIWWNVILASSTFSFIEDP